jgi:TolB-like protein
MFPRRYIVIALVLALAAPALAAGKKRVRKRKTRPTVAIWNVRELGLDKQVARKVRYDLVQAFSRTSGFRLLSEKLVAKRLKRAPAGLTPEKAAARLKATWVLTGTLGGLGEEVSLDLKLLDGRSGREVRRVVASVPMEIQPRRAVLDELLIRLLDPSRWVGSLGLDVSVDGAQVHLDGTQIATTPLASPLTGLAPGKHILRITKEGYGEFSKFVVIRYNQLARLKVDLNNAMVVGLIYEQGKPKQPKPQPETPAPAPQPEPEVIVQEIARPPSKFKTVMAWTLLGLGAGFVAAGVTAMVLNDPPPNDSRTLTILTPICYTAGGLTLAGSLLLFLLSGDQPSADAAEESAYSIHPLVMPDGLGLGLGGRF